MKLIIHNERHNRRDTRCHNNERESIKRGEEVYMKTMTGQKYHVFIKLRLESVLSPTTMGVLTIGLVSIKPSGTIVVVVVSVVIADEHPAENHHLHFVACHLYCAL